MKNELSPHDEPSGACPTFFKALCYEASQGGDTTKIKNKNEASAYITQLLKKNK